MDLERDQRKLHQRARTAPADTMTALNALLKKRFEESFDVSDTAKSDPELAELAVRIERGDTAPGALRVPGSSSAASPRVSLTQHSAG
jgi:hypothetical protein